MEDDYLHCGATSLPPAAPVSGWSPRATATRSSLACLPRYRPAPKYHRPPGQPTVPTTSSVLSPPADAQTSLVSTGNLLPPSLSQIGGLVQAQAPTSLPCSNQTSNPSWIYTVAQQAAQSAITQALALQPAIAQQGPTPPTLTPAVQLSQAASAPTQPLPGPPVQTVIPPSLAAGPSSAQPSTTQPASLLPIPPALPTGISASIAGFNLPGELSGMLPHTIITKIQNLQYFDLSALIPANLATARDPQPIRVQVGGNESQHLVLSRRPIAKKTITTIQDWAIVFSMYASVITTADASRGPDLFEYMRLILQAENEYKGDAWSRYDIAFRTRAANRHIVRWAEPDSTLWNRAFSGMCRTSSFCSICLDSTHTTSECPLYQQGPATHRSTTPAGPIQQSGADPRPTARQVCLNWNRGKCSFTNCRRAHVCATHGCGGDHRFSDCPKRRLSPRKTSNNPN